MYNHHTEWGLWFAKPLAKSARRRQLHPLVVDRMHPLVAHLRSSLKSLGALGRPIVVGVSGGADSVALLRAFLQLEAASPVTAAHLNHQLRGAAADADEKWVFELVQRLQVPAAIGSQDVAGLADTLKIGVEEASRLARYQFLEQTARDRGADCIALAHTADDQAETVLHHIVRGTGLAGLTGMHRSRTLPGSGVLLIRPFLDVRRDALRGYLADLNQPFREDASNLDEQFTRNRIRRSLLPALASDYNPRIVEHLTHLAGLARDAQSVVEQRALHLLTSEIVADASTDSAVRIDVARLQDEHRHVIREMFVQLWTHRGWPRQKMGFDHWNSLADLVLGETRAVHLPGGIEARRRRGIVEVRLQSGANK